MAAPAGGANTWQGAREPGSASVHLGTLQRVNFRGHFLMVSEANERSTFGDCIGGLVAVHG